MIAGPVPATLSMRRRLTRYHRWLGLGAALFWLVQALTGMAIVFHWEMSDAALADVHRPTDLAAIERRIDVLAPPGSGAKPQSVWTSAGFPDRYDISVDAADGSSKSVRVAGDGSVLRNGGDGGILDLLVEVHHNLLAGTTGDWIVGISGLLLVTNLGFGLVAAMPRPGQWRRALTPSSKGPAAARLYSWHRALGLWALLPMLALAGTGTLLKFEDGVGALVGAEDVALPANPPAGPPVGFAAAARAALGAIPGSTLTAVKFPAADDATYRVRVLAPGEIRRAYGASVVLVDANTGRVRGLFPIADASPARTFMSALVPIHTGESGGLAGRFLVLALGLWLTVMIVAGVLLWQKRRPKPKPRA